MSLAIDSTLQYLCKRLCIPPERVDQYREKTIVEILEAEAAQGNQQAIALAADMFTDVDKLIELFQLADINNKLTIFSAMEEEQRKELIPLLDVEDLIQGLYYFDEDKLLEMLENIPMEELVKVAFQMFTQKEIIEYMPDKYINEFLTSDKLDKDFVLKNVKELPEVYIRQMIESITGEDAQGDSIDLINQLRNFDDIDYKNALLNLEKNQKRVLTLLLTTSDKKLYENFNPKAYTFEMAIKRDKKTIIQSMDVIKPEHLHKMIEKLPEDLLQIVLTQIEPEKLADSLINKHPELLAKFVAG